MIFIPEQKIKALIDLALDQIDESYLFRLFGNLQLGDYNYFEQASALFLKRIDSPRKISSNLFFNKDRQGLPTIHIALNDEHLGEGNGMGFDPGMEQDSQTGSKEFVNTTTRVYASRYNIVFTSNNTFEVLIMYNTFKAWFQGNVHLLQLNGLNLPQFSGHDLVLTDYLMPADIYSRGFIIDCIYNFTAPASGTEEIIDKIEFGVCYGFRN